MKRKKENPPKRSYEEKIEDLLEELRKPHTEEEYEAIQRKFKWLLVLDFIRYTIAPLTVLICNIILLLKK